MSSHPSRGFKKEKLHSKLASEKVQHVDFTFLFLQELTCSN